MVRDRLWRKGLILFVMSWGLKRNININQLLIWILTVIWFRGRCNFCLVWKCKNQWRRKSGNNDSEIWSLNFEVWSPKSEVWSLKIPLAFRTRPIKKLDKNTSKQQQKIPNTKTRVSLQSEEPLKDDPEEQAVHSTLH
jgi:hypothetical protein